MRNIQRNWRQTALRYRRCRRVRRLVLKDSESEEE